ncbi:MAG TPA: malto-oligosyltrehalose trehalohydrolase, partial [Deinococcales bacterium]|nr:malto-oligosyltrehalose trehalohydrolase [Deinococcales bacterium]
MQQDRALGAFPDDAGTTFRAWSTRAASVEVVLHDGDGNETARHPMTAGGDGLFEVHVPAVGTGALYKFALDGQAFPDPYARLLPRGVHGPAAVWAPSYQWRHAAPAFPEHQRVLYELHVGTFTPEGTYEAARGRLGHLCDLGINTIELLPLSSFPGERGWGYDGVAHFAPYAPYGSPEELMHFVDEAHGLGLQVLLDMVYNHLGPDGNYLGAYSPEYFTGNYQTPWGQALDFTNPFMRRYVLDSAEHWLRHYRLDGFRLDATAYIFDPSPRHILQELAEHVHALGSGHRHAAGSGHRHAAGNGHVLHAEDHRNEPAVVRDYGLDAVWTDDFHHQLRVLLTGERDWHYAAYEPRVSELARCINRGWTYEGQVYPIGGHERGKPADGLESENFLYFIQNHDQIGNRAFGDRLQDASGRDLFLAASTLLLFLPMLPMLFQGQEWMAGTPFQYFSHHEGELGAAVSKGRLEEFKEFAALSDPSTRARIPDPQAESTFANSKLDWSEPQQPQHAAVLE